METLNYSIKMVVLVILALGVLSLDNWGGTPQLTNVLRLTGSTDFGCSTGSF